MAGEVGHVIYGARLLTYLGDKVQQPTYWIGTLFPDIRHLGVVSRYRTHPAGVSLQSVVGTNDWHTGLRGHAWIDATREEFLKQQHIKESLPWHPFVPHALKLVEDEWLYNEFDDWNLLQRVLAKIDDSELEFVPERAVIQKWHTLLQQYFLHPPTDISRRQLALDIGLSEQSADEINKVVATIKKHKKTRMVVDDFLVHLERLLH